MIPYISSIHYTDVKVKKEGTVRLVGGPGPYEGQVEIHFQGRWGTVCSNGWDMNDATVVCHQLGYPTALQDYSQAEEGSGSGSGLNSIDTSLIWLDNVRCWGTEANLTQCRSSDLWTQNCRSNRAAGVKCASEPQKMHS